MGTCWIRWKKVPVFTLLLLLLLLLRITSWVKRRSDLSNGFSAWIAQRCSTEINSSTERKNWIGCHYYRPNTVINVRVLRYLRHRTRSNKVKAHRFILLFNLTRYNRTDTRLVLHLANSSIHTCIYGCPMSILFSPSLSVYCPST